MKGVNTIEVVAKSLQGIAFPILVRPPVKPRDPPTEELIQWAIRMYAYSVTAQVRKMLEASLLLANAENIPASYVIGRHIFEWAAHACYMSRRGP